MTHHNRYFPIAPMDRRVQSHTLTFLTIPLLFFWFGIVFIPPPYGVLLILAGIGSILAAIAILLWVRPYEFEVSPTELVIKWPRYSRRIRRSNLVAVWMTTGANFWAENGLALRFDIGGLFGGGLGGLFGGFGKLWTMKGGTWETYITRTDDLVVVQRRGEPPLLLTPVHPTDFVKVLSKTKD